MKEQNRLNRRLSVTDMAERLGVDRKRIEHWANIGILHSVCYGNSMYFSRLADLEFFKEWQGFDLSTAESSVRAVEMKKKLGRFEQNTTRA